MSQFSPSSHVSFVSRELQKLLPEGSFVSRVWRSIGEELHYRLVECPFDDEIEYSKYHPVDVLFMWVSQNSGLDPEFLIGHDGNYVDDAGEVIPPTANLSYSGVEQLAAYGLWLLNVKMNSYGPPAERDYTDQGWNPNGWTREDVYRHQIPYTLLAYQALSYSQRMLLGTKLSIEELEKVVQFDFSVLGKRGAENRHASMRELREWTLDQFRTGSWPSANRAAYDLKDKVMAHGRTINAELKAQNAQRTIAAWINASLKTPV